MATIQSVRGTKDILPSEIKQWHFVESTIRAVCKQFGYSEIRTPIFEKTEVFSRGVGDSTDIVNKEMYTFLDRGDESLTLRPEQTAALVRAVIQNNLITENAVNRLYYIGSYFRYERPQKGRLREFHQLGVECLNSPNPEADAEIISLANTFINKIGISDYTLNLNTLGNEQTRKNYHSALKDFLTKQKEYLSADSQNRININPLRVLDSKNEGDIEILKDAPIVLNYLDEESTQHFERVKGILDAAGIRYTMNSKLVRGLDYYSHTVFEFQSTALGSQDAFGGGGRYNSLFSELGGKDVSSAGFAMGIERILLVLLQINNKIEEDNIDVAVIPTSPIYYDRANFIANIVRSSGKSCILDVNRKSMKSQLRDTNRLKAKYAIIIGEDEYNNDTASIKFLLENKEQICVPINIITEYIK